jgi:hypothetical protein
MYDAIKQLFPDMTSEDCSLQDDGDGPYIKEWKRPEPRPSESDIAGAQFEVNKKRAIGKIDADTDRIITDTIGARAEEYRQAHADALAYQAAGWQGDVPPFVANHQAAKTADGWTARQAAEDILATATSWLNAQGQIRTQRLWHKEQARRAVDRTALDLALAQWSGFVAAMRIGLGL